MVSDEDKKTFSELMERKLHGVPRPSRHPLSIGDISDINFEMVDTKRRLMGKWDQLRAENQWNDAYIKGVNLSSSCSWSS